MAIEIECVEKTDKYRVLKEDGRLFVHVGNDEHSYMTVMDLTDPHHLSAPYARTMLLPLAFIPSPTDLVLIGLGGGQQAKFIHRYLPELHTTALEVDPEMVMLARSHFDLPNDDARLRVVVADAADFIHNHRDKQCDMILSDACSESYEPVDALHTVEFYSACHQMLRPGGIMTVNVYNPIAAWANRFMSTVSAVFPCKKFIPVSQEQGVMILWKDSPNLDWDAIERRAAVLDSRVDLGFRAFCESLKRESVTR